MHLERHDASWQEREQAAAGTPGELQQFNYKSISKMNEYQNKSFEELRCEDYVAQHTRVPDSPSLPQQGG